MSDDKPGKPCFYGRRMGRPLHVRKAALMRDFLPRVAIELPTAGRLDPFALFEHKPQRIWLEIGFGGGEHLAAQAQRHPTTGFIGCEPFRNGVASLLDHIERDAIANIRVFPDDARPLLDRLPDAAIDRCFVLFADPWPKLRHEERRFIGPENLPRLARVLAPGAELRLATDDGKLAAWMLLHMRQAAAFEEIHNASAPPADWLPTRYEQKAMTAGRPPVYRTYRRKRERRAEGEEG